MDSEVDKLRNNTLNIKHYNEGLEAMKSPLNLNIIFLSNKNTPFSPFKQTPISNILDDTDSNFEYNVEYNEYLKCPIYGTCLVSI